jgi:hypothetical protein
MRVIGCSVTAPTSWTTRLTSPGCLPAASAAWSIRSWANGLVSKPVPSGAIQR